jgi:hypothetical protein
MFAFPGAMTVILNIASSCPLTMPRGIIIVEDNSKIRIKVNREFS